MSSKNKKISFGKWLVGQNNGYEKRENGPWTKWGVILTGVELSDLLKQYREATQE